MQRKTLGNLKANQVAKRLGMAPCSEEFLGLVNRAQEMLSFAGRWWGTYQQLRLCPQGNCIVWPRGVMNCETLKRENVVIPVRTLWYEWQSMVIPPITDPAKQAGNISANLLDRGNTPLMSDIVPTGNAKKVRVYCASSADAGARILIQGLDWTGNPIRTNDSVAGWVDGEYVLASVAGTSSVNQFSVVTGVQKTLTKSFIRLYEFDTVALTERQIANYEASELNPDYRTSLLSGFSCATTANNEPDGCDTLPACSLPLLVAIVRLEVQPVAVDSDWLLIQHLGALEDAMRAIQYQSDKHLPLDAEPNMQLAIRKLRQELEARTGGPQQIIINANPGPPQRRFIGLF